MMKYNIITLFPELIENYCSTSILGRAQKNNVIAVETVNPRTFTHDVHRTVDDTPYGGGSGMVLKCEPIFSAVRSVERSENSQLILTTPQGIPYNQQIATELAQKDQLIIICGHYEGYDERIRIGLNPLELSLGDYVLTGGELAAMCIIDSTARLLNGVLGKDDSVFEESHNNYLLEYPHYTRPAEFEGMEVPAILKSGHHKNIEKWRKQQSLIRTLHKRPELLEKAILSKEEKRFLKDYRSNHEMEQ